ncbi:MAG: ATP-dependent ligase LigC [Hyphomicrobiales bacterium]|nr:ATP-dependent ligase LigC [Hyphomicrobiales bacterium]
MTDAARARGASEAGRRLAESAAPDFLLSIETAPMEARSAAVLPDEPGAWLYEPKWDGFRCLAFKDGSEVDLRAKSGKPLGRYFPEMLAALRSLPARRFVIDGELVIETNGQRSFDSLQMRLHPAQSRIARLAAETPAKYVLFDILATAADRKLVDRPLEKRRAALEAFVTKIDGSDAVLLSPATRSLDEALVWLKQAGQGATDGVVAKPLSGVYEPGVRSMIKVKRLRTADCVVGGFRYSSTSRQVASLLLGLYNEAGKLDHVGFTSSIAKSDRAALTKRLEKLRATPGFTGKSPGAPSRWTTARSTEWEPLRPEIVVEVRFDHVTGRRFRHGAAFVRWRPDKSPRQCTFDQIE